MTGAIKPFLKWAGGKSQLLPQLRACYPPELRSGSIRRYVEPFLGGGAVYLDVVQSFGIDEAHLFDVNQEIILAYTVVQRAPRALIEVLSTLRQTYHALNDAARADFFYAVRAQHNVRKQAIDLQHFADAWIEHAAQMIFLNKTCYNGLYRVNAAGGFNVPFGRYRNPEVFDADNLLRISQLLQKATLHVGGFESCAPYAADAFIYFDPPYRPISPTSSFTSYAKSKFGDEDQRALAGFFAHLAATTNAHLMLSNSDPANVNPADTFFDDLYAAFTVRRVAANRMINSVAGGRGKITEILVTNY